MEMSKEFESILSLENKNHKTICSIVKEEDGTNKSLKFNEKESACNDQIIGESLNMLTEIKEKSKHLQLGYFIFLYIIREYFVFTEEEKHYLHSFVIDEENYSYIKGLIVLLTDFKIKEELLIHYLTLLLQYLSDEKILLNIEIKSSFVLNVIDKIEYLKEKNRKQRAFTFCGRKT